LRTAENTFEELICFAFLCGLLLKILPAVQVCDATKA